MRARQADTTESKKDGRRNPTKATTARRYNLAYSRLYGLVAKASSKSYSAFLRPLGSRFTGVSVSQHAVGPSYVLSTRI